MAASPPPTAAMLQQLQRQLGLIRWPLRHCSACSAPIGYTFANGEPFWSEGCDCQGGELELRTWQDVANDYARAPAPVAWGLSPGPPALPEVRRPSLQQVLAELAREASVRQRVYPEWAAGRKNGLTPDVAAHRLACIDEAQRLLQVQAGLQGSLF